MTIQVTTDDNRATIGEAITHLNTTAKSIRRRGLTGVRSAAYAVKHDQINTALDEWQAARG